MKLIEQIMQELGADMLKSITLVPNSCCYVKSVKSVTEFSAERVVLAVGKTLVTVEGEGLQLGEYFEGDAFVRGKVRGVKID